MKNFNQNLVLLFQEILNGNKSAWETFKVSRYQIGNGEDKTTLEPDEVDLLFLKMLAEQESLESCVPGALFNAIDLLDQSQKNRQIIFTQKHENKLYLSFRNLALSQKPEYNAVFLYFTGPTAKDVFFRTYRNIFLRANRALNDLNCSASVKAQAKANLAFLYQNNFGLNKEDNLAEIQVNRSFYFYKGSAENGNFLAQFYFGSMYDIWKENAFNRLNYYNQSTNRSTLDLDIFIFNACVLLVSCTKESYKYYKKAADQNYAPAQTRLALLLQETEKRIEIIKALPPQRQPDNFLDFVTNVSEWINQDNPTTLLSRAASQGDIEAKYQLTCIDKTKTILGDKLIKEAENQGYCDTQKESANLMSIEVQNFSSSNSTKISSTLQQFSALTLAPTPSDGDHFAQSMSQRRSDEQPSPPGSEQRKRKRKEREDENIDNSPRHTPFFFVTPKETSFKETPLVNTPTNGFKL